MSEGDKGTSFTPMDSDVSRRPTPDVEPRPDKVLEPSCPLCSRSSRLSAQRWPIDPSDTERH